MTKRNQTSVFYWAPVYRYIENNLIYATPGISTQLPWQPTPGCHCHWTNSGLPVEVADEYTASNWQRILVSKVPAGFLSPDINTANLIMKNEARVISVIPTKDASPNWEVIELAIIPEDYWKSYGEFYSNKNSAHYYELDKVLVELKDKNTKVPPTWILKGDE